jgi:peptidoglycan/xylan/chitin deacetylase (PgdA/CDA1 family)
MRFAIRDDDTCSFTRPEDLDNAYRWLPASIPVSLAVTPFAVQSFHLGDPLKFHQGTIPLPLDANPDLLALLREGAAAGRWSFLCHGFTHEYQQTKGGLIGECVWKPAERQRRELRTGREYLEEQLGQAVDTFVPPGNAIGPGTIEAMKGTFRGAFAAIPLRRWPAFAKDPDHWPVLARRAWQQIRWRGANVFPQCVRGLRLLASTPLTPIVSLSELLDAFHRCRRAGADFSVAVHYWELKGGVADNLRRLVDEAVGVGCEFTTCRVLLHETKPNPSAQEEAL